VFLSRPDGTVAQIGELQQGWDGVRLSDAEVIHFKSFDGTDIEAALMKPLTAAVGGKVPLVVFAHGGSASNFTADYFWFNAWSQLFAARGYQVLMVTPTLTVHLERDKANPASQSLALYRALKHLGVESVLVTDPEQGHVPGQEQHQVDVMKRMVDWYDRHLK
jgi:dipeptidyl aminopeptidase/acylaminoacyl peptidase